MSTFDPNGVGIANGNIFGFPYSEQEADIVLIPVPWDATASYGKGASNGPQAILDASTQLDFYHPKLERAYETKIYMSPVSKEWLDINARLCAKGMEYISCLEEVGEEKAQIFIALLGKHMGVVPKNWKTEAGVFSDTNPRTVADITSPETLLMVRTWKKAEKAAARDKQSRPLKAKTSK